jgi:hypothetical protein
MPFLRERRWLVASTTEKQVDEFFSAENTDQFPHGAEHQKENDQPHLQKPEVGPDNFRP